jgi:hypothetical protein
MTGMQRHTPNAMTRDEIREHVEFYFKVKKPVHITRKFPGFRRGMVLRPFGDSTTMELQEEEMGPLILSLDEIASVALRMPPRKKAEVQS